MERKKIRIGFVVGKTNNRKKSNEKFSFTKTPMAEL